MSDSERRRFFRIDDQVSLTFEPIDIDNQSSQLANLDEQKHMFTLMAELQKVDSELSAVYYRLKQKSHDLANYLDGLNKKIHTLGSIILTSHTDIPSKPTHDVNVSAGGIAFAHPAPLEVGQEVLLKVVFYPSFYGLFTKAIVADCRQAMGDKGEYEIGLEYIEMDEADRDVLMQLILRKQSEQLKTERELREQKSA